VNDSQNVIGLGAIKAAENNCLSMKNIFRIYLNTRQKNAASLLTNRNEGVSFSSAESKRYSTRASSLF